MLRLSVLVISISILVMGWSAAARATMVLRLTEGASSVTITDGGSGDLDAMAGVISFNGSVGVFAANVTVGFSKPSVPHSGIKDTVMALNSSTTSTVTFPATLTISLTDQDFVGGHFADFTSSLFGNFTGSGGSITASALIDINNNLFAGSNICGPLIFNSSPFSASCSGIAARDANYSLTLSETVTVPSLEFVTFAHSLRLTQEIVQTTEPASMLLLGMGLVAVGIRGRNFRRTARWIGWPKHPA